MVFLRRLTFFTMLMKKTLLSLLLAMFAIIVRAQTPQVPYQGQPVQVSVYIIKQTGATYGHPHAPAKMPTVTIDGNTLHFYDAHPSGYNVWLEDEGTVVYSTSVSDTEWEILLPANLTGEYTLYFEDDRFIYQCTLIL